MPAIYTRQAIASLSIALLGLAAACGDSSGSSARDTKLAPTGKAQPQGNDAPVRKGTKPPAEAGGVRKLLGLGPKMGTIDAGASFGAVPSGRVCTSTNKVGSTFTAATSAPVNGSNGLVVPTGSVVELRVSESAQSQNSKDNVKLAFEAVSVQVAGATYPLDARVARPADLELVRAQSTTTQAGKVGAGAAIGAIAGQVIGHNTRSTVTGAVVGAAAGTAVAMGTADYDGCLKEGTKIEITLNAPLKVLVSKKSS